MAQFLLLFTGVVAEFQSSAQKRSSVRVILSFSSTVWPHVCLLLLQYGANGGTGPAFPDLLLAADDDKLLDFGGTDIDIDIDVDIEIDMEMD